MCMLKIYLRETLTYCQYRFRSVSFVLLLYSKSKRTTDLNLQLADATPITSVELLKDVPPQLPSVKLFKDVTPQVPRGC
jgi:hypothetical protein